MQTFRRWVQFHHGFGTLFDYKFQYDHGCLMVDAHWAHKNIHFQALGSISQCFCWALFDRKCKYYHCFLMMAAHLTPCLPTCRPQQLSGALSSSQPAQSAQPEHIHRNFGISFRLSTSAKRSQGVGGKGGSL